MYIHMYYVIIQNVFDILGCSQMTKLKQFRNKFDVSYSRENDCGLRACSVSQAVQHSS